MKIDYNLKLEQSQKLIITPELKLAITLLQYSSLELIEHIEQELLDNPVLEIQDNPEPEKEQDKESENEEAAAAGEAAAAASADDLPWEEYFRDMDLDSSYYAPVRSREDAEHQPTVENCAGMTGSMQEDLCAQLRMLNLSPHQFNVAAYLAGNLDHNGYLQGELEDLTEAIGAEPAETEDALKVIQKLEPAGIGCRNLQECLLLQLQRLDDPPQLAVAVVTHYLPAAADGRYRFLTGRLGCTEEQVKEAVDFIRTLNPKPGSIFGEGEETRYIVPDILVEKIDGQYLVTANDSRIPHLVISPFYQQILRDGAGDEQLSSYVKAKIEKAYWLIRSIEQRRITLFKVAQEIVRIQEAFLELGIKNLKPLTLKEVATNIGVHESTVSRASAGKYIQTPRGLFPLKFFFSSGLTGAGGVDYSSHSIKTYMRELIDAEDADRPLSDQNLAELLQDKGINISRRTVAKYREELALPASYKRRRS